MMVALLHSNGQLRTERDGDTEKGCQKPALQHNTTDYPLTTGDIGSAERLSLADARFFTGWMV